MKAMFLHEMKVAMKERDKLKVNTIRSILSAIQYEEMRQEREELQEDEVIAVLKNEAKKRKEELEFVEKAGRAEQVESLNQELAVIESFLPEQLDETKLRQILAEYKGSNADANMGGAMKFLKEQYHGHYDGKLASTLAREIFG